MFNKMELVGGGVIVALLALAVYLTQVESILLSGNQVNQVAQVASTEPDPVTIVTEAEGDNSNQIRANAYVDAADSRGNITRMVIDDIKVGTGDVVEEGDSVVVNYVGTLQDGTEFDNSKKRGQPFEFKVGGGMVIPGWEQGLVGMKEGGERVLVIPPELAYGENGIGPIPPNATLVFSIELIEVK